MQVELERILALAADQRFGEARYLAEIQDLVANDQLDRAHLEGVLGPEDSGIREEIYLRCVNCALQDHALTAGELFALNQLRRAFALQDRSLLESHPKSVAQIVEHVFTTILVDGVIDEEEVRYKTALQEALALGYDDFMKLGLEPTRNAVAALQDVLDPEGRGLTDDLLLEYETRARRLAETFRLWYGASSD